MRAIVGVAFDAHRVRILGERLGENASSAGNAPRRTAWRRRSRTGCRCGSRLRPRVHGGAPRSCRRSTSGASAFSISSATRASCRRHDDPARAAAGLVDGAAPRPSSSSFDRDRFEHLARLPVRSSPAARSITAMSAPEPRVFSPTCTGSSVRGAPRNAACSESDSTRNLPSLIDEMRVHHHEERQQQRDQVAVGNGPRFVVDVIFVFALAAPCRATIASGREAPFC